MISKLKETLSERDKQNRYNESFRNLFLNEKFTQAVAQECIQNESYFVKLETENQMVNMKGENAMNILDDIMLNEGIRGVIDPELTTSLLDDNEFSQDNYSKSYEHDMDPDNTLTIDDKAPMDNTDLDGLVGSTSYDDGSMIQDRDMEINTKFSVEEEIIDNALFENASPDDIEDLLG